MPAFSRPAACPIAPRQVGDILRRDQPAHPGAWGRACKRCTPGGVPGLDFFINSVFYRTGKP